MTFREVLNWGKEKLKNSGIAEYELDAWLLLEYVTGISRALFFVKDHEEMMAQDRETYETLIRRRSCHIPLQHITNTQEFMGYEFYVNEHVLVPRQDTEILVEEADRIASEKSMTKILDLCCGSGCILLSLLKMGKNRNGIGSDISEEALKVAKINRERLHISEERVTFLKGDLFENISGRFDLIVSNPPYIRTAEIETLQEEVRLHDPFEALDGKEDGLFFYRRIVNEAERYLEDNGVLLFEIGYDQADDVRALMEEADFENVQVKKDLAGLDRVMGGVYNRAREK